MRKLFKSTTARASNRHKGWALNRALSLERAARRMPPKKKEVEGPGPLLGRFGTSLKCGIVGLPNVGLVAGLTAADVFFFLCERVCVCFVCVCATPSRFALQKVNFLQCPDKGFCPSRELSILHHRPQ